MNKDSEYPSTKFIKGDYDALNFILKELANFDENRMEFGYDVEFPKIYNKNTSKSRNEYSNNLLLGNKTTGDKYTSTPEKGLIKAHMTKKNIPGTSKEVNRPSNMSTIVPRISTSNNNILEVDTLVTKNSQSPYKDLKLPSLTPNKIVPKYKRTQIPSSRNNLKAVQEGSVYSSATKHSKYSKKALDITTEINYSRAAEETESLHELIILTLSQAFGAKPRQAAGIVPHNFQFLTVAVVKGK